MKTNRFLSLLIIILLGFSFVSCKKDNNGNNSNNGKQEEIVLPNKEEVKTVSKDEIIYINMAGDGKILSMKATNRITDSIFSYYKEYGSFLLNDNSNITSPKAPIIIEEDYALIPSLQKNDNMFYSLSLDSEYYETKLPFVITVEYKLDGKVVQYSQLKGASGKLDMTYDFKPNRLANEYFLTNFAAQVQIPFNINNAKNIVAKDAMQNTLVGQTATLVYMILPNSHKTFTISLDAVDFTFEGMQAVLQPFDLNSITSLLPIDFDANINILELGNLISLDLNSFSQFENIELFLNFGEVSQMFAGLDDLFDLLAIIPNLDALEDPNIFEAAHLGEMAEIVQIKRTIDYFINNFADLQLLLTSLENKLLPFMNKYNNDFNKIEQIFTQIAMLEQIIGSLEVDQAFTINSIIENIDALIPMLKIIINSVNTIRNNLNDVIKSFYFIAQDLEPIADDLATLLQALEAMPLFYSQFEQLGTKLGMGKAMGWFKESEVYKIDLILQGLNNLQDYEEAFVIDEQIIQLITNVVELFNKDNKTNIRNIDQLILQMLIMNESLSTPEKDKLAVYNIVDLLSMLINYASYLPSGEKVVISFLSSDNIEPNSIQFIIKQRGV